MSRPLALRPGVQIKLPDANCLFLSASRDIHAIGPDDGVDVLTSIGKHAFAEFYDRAAVRSIDGRAVAFLSESDIETVSPAKQ